MKRIVPVLATCMFLFSSRAAGEPGDVVLLEPPGQGIEIPLQGVSRAGVTLSIQDGWHIYSTQHEGFSPQTEITLDPEGAFELVRIEEPEPRYTTYEWDPTAEDWYFEGEVTFTLVVRPRVGVPVGPSSLRGEVIYTACDPNGCLPPNALSFEIPVSVVEGEGETIVSSTADAGGGEGVRGDGPSSEAERALERGPLLFLLLAAGWGFATLLTPCVYPMVPVTIAFFSKQERKGAAALTLAGVYVLGIILLFTLIGILASVLVKGGVVAFGNNPYVNLFVGIVFVVFALSLFGAFELRLPSGLLNRVASGPRQGMMGALFLGFVFAVTSFACTAPFAGSVLAIGVQSGRWLWPAIGMIGFSAALALPFFFLAAFPGMLRSLPRSGSWMETVKHVCAFVELGAALKFLGAADIFLWEVDLFTRPVVISLWAALGLATGFYLLGAFRFHGERTEGVGTLRVLLGTMFVALGIYFGAGLASGARLGPWEAFLTVPEGTAVPSRNGGGNGQHRELPWIDGDLPAALALAETEGKRVFVDFTAPT